VRAQSGQRWRQSTQPSLPGLTPKSGVPDFGALKITKVGNIRLCLQSIFLKLIIFDDGYAGQARV
jgi:NADPH-dependent 7-cyano-7-deazaguanine reductase QueF